MPVLTIALADMRRLCGLVIGDTSADSDFTALITAEQAVVEYMLDPAQLALVGTNAGLAATLTLGVTELLAARYLQQQARVPGMLDDFTVGPLHVVTSKSLNLFQVAQLLGQHGAARLAPFGLAPGALSGLLVNAKTGKVSGTGPGDLLAVPPALDGATATTTALGLFGTLQGNAAGQDDAEPPDEFKSGYVSFNDPSSLGET